MKTQAYFLCLCLLIVNKYLGLIEYFTPCTVCLKFKTIPNYDYVDTHILIVPTCIPKVKASNTQICSHINLIDLKSKTRKVVTKVLLTILELQFIFILYLVIQILII